ncbi:hypothetical protein RN001_003743 [Aquatica leii]|uniref:HECT domain-containing protein n=1 Tax=Aquatica leii TaxID=1421715 RepID=A0AAN7PIS4_9COLE|nr:hypothetical protein RN001_003743 [Aquatica leii]
MADVVPDVMRTPLRSISNVSPGPSTSQSVQPPLSVASPSPSTSQCVLPPLPIAKKRAVRQRTKVPSLLISSTPVKLYFENKENEKREAVEKAQRRLRKKEEKEKLENKKKKATNSRKKRVESSESEDSNDEVDVIYAETSNDDMDFGEEDKNVCAICGEIGKTEHQAQSQTLLACAADTENTAAAIQLKNEVFLRIRADDIALIAKKDDLIRRNGENYLKRHKRAQIVVTCSNKIRECAKLLKETRRRKNNNKLTFFDIISTRYYDIIVASAKTISRYDDTLKEYWAPSLAIHLGLALSNAQFSINWSQDEIYNYLIELFRPHLDDTPFELMVLMNRRLIKISLPKGENLNGKSLKEIFRQKVVYVRPLHEIVRVELETTLTEEDHTLDNDIPTSSANDISNNMNDDIEEQFHIDTETAITKSLAMDKEISIKDILTRIRGHIKDTISQFNIYIYRDDIFNCCVRAMRRKTFNEYNRISVKFSDIEGNSEGAVDLGGPTREMFRIVLNYIKNSKLFFGSDKKSISLSNDALKNKEYFETGRLIGLSLIHGGTGPHFFSEKLYSILVFGFSETQFTIEEVEPEIKDKILKLLEFEDLPLLQEYFQLPGAISFKILKKSRNSILSEAEKRKKKKENETSTLQQRNSLAKLIIINESVSEEGSEKNKEIKIQTEESATFAIDDERSNNEDETVKFEERTICATDVKNNKRNNNEEESERQYEFKLYNISADCGKNENDSVFPNDIALWPLHLSDKMIQYYLINKPCNTGDITTLKVEYTDRNQTKGGIYPVSRNVIPESLYDAVSLKKWKDSKVSLVVPEENKQPPEEYVNSLIEETATYPFIFLENTEKNTSVSLVNIIVLDSQEVDEPESDNQTVVTQHNSLPVNPRNQLSACSTKQTTFEELLLETLKSNNNQTSSNRKRKVASGAEVITAEEVKLRLKEKEIMNTKSKTPKRKWLKKKNKEKRVR